MNSSKRSRWNGVTSFRPEVFWRAFLAVLLCAFLAGCGGLSAPTSVEGAWLGEGEFHSSAGSMEVETQLELLSDGTYRFLMLKPAILALTGAETGTWAMNGSELILTRGTDTTSQNPGGVFGALRKGSGGAAKPPKQMTVSNDLREIKFNDGKMELVFARNPAATEKLRASGDVRDK